MIERDYYFKVNDVKAMASLTERKMQDAITRDIEAVNTRVESNNGLGSLNIFEAIVATGDVRLGIFLLSSTALNAIQKLLTSRQRANEIKDLSDRSLVLTHRIKTNESLAAGELAYKGQVDQSVRILAFKN